MRKQQKNDGNNLYVSDFYVISFVLFVKGKKRLILECNAYKFMVCN